MQTAAAAVMAWPERLLSWRDRLYASPAFHHWASALPFTRALAQRRARALFDIVAGFVYSQVLLAAVRLRLFEILAEGPQSLEQLAPRLKLPAEGCARLLDAAVSLRLLQRRRGGLYGLGPLGGPMVGNTALLAMVEHHAVLYGDLHDPVALLRGEAGAAALAGMFPYANVDSPGSLDPARVASYSALMSASQPMVADQILDAYPLQQHRCLLDVGGGEGTFLSRVAQRAPDLKLMLFDLPAVADRARAQFVARGLAERASAFGGDFLADELPRGADVISLVRVVHDHDDARVLRIMKAARRALPDDGTLLLAEQMADTAGAEPMGDAYFGFYLLAMGRGRPRSPAQIRALLEQAGFGDVRLQRTRLPLQARLIVARCRLS